MEKLKKQNKIEEYRRLVDKKIQDISIKPNESSREKSKFCNVSF